MQVLLSTQSTSTSAPSQSTNVTINDLPSDSIALILRKTLHPHYPGAIWGKNLYTAVHEARWFLMDGRNQSHRVLDKFPHDACIASVQTCHAIQSALVCKRWNRIIRGEEGPGVIEHVAICGKRMASRLPRTVKTLLIHGQTSDMLWRLASDNGADFLQLLFRIITSFQCQNPLHRGYVPLRNSDRLGMTKYAQCEQRRHRLFCPSFRHVMVTTSY